MLFFLKLNIKHPVVITWSHANMPRCRSNMPYYKYIVCFGVKYIVDDHKCVSSSILYALLNQITRPDEDKRLHSI